MSFGALQNAVFGMSAAQRSMEVTSRNISNASTPGYTKKSLAQEAVYVGGQAMGVTTGDVTRNIDQVLQRTLWNQTGIATGYDTTTRYLERLQEIQGTTDGTNNMSAVITALENGFAELSAAPDDGIVQTKVVGLATNVARTMNQYSGSLQTLRNSTQTEMLSTVDTINLKLDQVSQLNNQILQIRAGGHSSADLEDQRDQVIKDLSGNIEISTYKTGDGAIAVQTKDGRALLADTRSYKLAFTPSNISYVSAYPATAAAITVNGVDITTSSTGGKLGALVQLRDQILPQQQAQLDELSHKMAMRFDAQGLKLFVDSSTGTVPADNVADYLGMSSRIKVNSAIVNDPSKLQKGTSGTPPNPGSNAVISKILNYTFGLEADAAGAAHTAYRSTGLGASGALATNMPSSATLSDFAQNFIASNAQYYSNLQGAQKYESDYQQNLEKSYLDQSGVSIDSEMANMIQLQKAYAANAKVFSSSTEMFDTLLQAV